MIKLVLLDIDGVLTDGRVTVDALGSESKTIHFHDIDAVFELKRRGYKVGFLTGEATPVTEYFRRRFKPDYFYNGCKDKPAALAEILADCGCRPEETCYVGDGKYDIAMMRLVGLSACPADAISEVRALAHMRLSAKGGEGCVWELLERLDSKRHGEFPPPETTTEAYLGGGLCGKV